MRRIVLLGVVSALVVLPAAAQPPEPSFEVRSFLAQTPPEMLQRAQGALLEQLLQGRVSVGEFAATIGAPYFGGTSQGLAATMMATALYDKQYITHWLTHYYALRGTIGEDLVEEAGIDGRCSDQRMTDNPASPSLGLNVYTDSQGRVQTAYWNTYYESVDNCTVYDNTDVTRYFVTWIYVPSARSARVWLGAHDYFKLWVNGALVLQRTSGGPKTFTADEYKGTASLTQGWNLLVFKQSFPQLGPSDSSNQDDKYKYFSLRFVKDAEGTSYTDIQAAFDPQCTDTSGSPGQYSRVWGPNIARLGGADGSQWNTQFTAFNGWHMPWRYLLHYYKEGNNSGVPNGTKELVLQPYQTQIFSNPLSALFGVSANEKGYMVAFRQYYNFLYSAATYRWFRLQVFNQAAGGTFGMEVPFFYRWENSNGGSFIGVPGGRARINFGMVPQTNQGAEVELRVYAVPEGSSTQITKSYGPLKGFFQINDILNDLGLSAAQSENLALRVDVINNSSGTSWFSYITINDGIPSQGKSGTSDPLMRVPNYFASMPPYLQ